MDSMLLGNKIRALLKPGDLYLYKELSKNEVVLIVPKNDVIRGSIGLPGLNDAFLMRRLTSNGVQRAVEQISEFGKPGVVAIYQDYPAEIGEVRRNLLKYFESLEDSGGKLIGVLVNQCQNVLEYIKPYWIPNPNFKDRELLGMVDDIVRKLFNPNL
jgi:hypothetical protein